MASPSPNRTPRLYHAVPILQALAIVGAALGTYVLVGGTLVGSLPDVVLGLAATQLLAFAIIPLVAARALTGSFAALGLERPRVRALVGALLVGASFWIINLTISAPIAEWLDRSQELTELETRLLEHRALAETLIAFALLPAIGEEILCRGVLARSIAARAPLWVAVVVSAAVFAALHLSLPRAAPMFLLGLLLGLVALRSGSLWPAMVLHATNNLVALLASRTEAVGQVYAPLARHPLLTLSGAAAATVVGLTLAISGQRNRPDTSP